MATKPTNKAAAAKKVVSPKPHMFPSLYTHGDQVSFIPMFRQCRELGISGEPARGQIIGVRFTKAKVFYDIVDDYYGVLFRDVDSAYVGKMCDLIKMMKKESTELVTETGKKIATAKKGGRK
jgi:hypothetical protein